MNETEILARAERARLILDDDLVVQALSDMRELIRTGWEESPARDKEAREHLYRYIKVIGQFESNLRRHMESGRLARADIEAKERTQSILARARERIRG